MRTDPDPLPPARYPGRSLRWRREVRGGLRVCAICGLLVLVQVVWAPVVQAEAVIISDYTFGRYFDPAWNAWDEKILSVYFDAQGDVTLRAGEGRDAVRGRLLADEGRDLIRQLLRAQELATQVRREGRDMIEELARYLKGVDDRRHGVLVTFFAYDQGRKSDVILFLQDIDNPLSTIELYLDPRRVAQLLDLLRVAEAGQR